MSLSGIDAAMAEDHCDRNLATVSRLKTRPETDSQSMAPRVAMSALDHACLVFVVDSIVHSLIWMQGIVLFVVMVAAWMVPLETAHCLLLANGVNCYWREPNLAHLFLAKTI